MSTIAPTTAGSSLLNTLSATPASTTVGAQANDAQMNQFLTLLTAQLKNQDPMQPTDPTQFVAQLAQFSTVEQLVQGNTKLDTISQSLSGLALGQVLGPDQPRGRRDGNNNDGTGLGQPGADDVSRVCAEPHGHSCRDHRCVRQSGAHDTGNQHRRNNCVRWQWYQRHASPHWAIQSRDGRTDDSGRVAIGRDAEYQREGDWRDAGSQRRLAASARRWPHG